MNVAELINELSKYDPSLEVRHSDGDVEGFIVCDVSVKECDGETFIELD